MTAKQLLQKYLEFFESKGHTIVPSASLIPENDPSVLFTTAGMQPMVPYLLGESHPGGTRITDVQKCLRTGDLEIVGDNTHHTFFQMLGNWSLGDYFKQEAISWSFEFLTSEEWLGIPLEKLAFTVYQGGNGLEKDEEAYEIWKSLGVPEARIAYWGEDNFWSAGETGPCGPSTEMFYWSGAGDAPETFDPADETWVEIWNDVFMAFKKSKRTILVDGMHTLYDENFTVDNQLLNIVDSHNTNRILTVNGHREKGKSVLPGFEAFSLEEEGIKKSDVLYFERLLDTFNLKPEEVIYFDHKQESVDTAVTLGITSVIYNNKEQVAEFLRENIYVITPLSQKNVDTGMGLERTAAVLAGKKSAYETDLFMPIIKKIEDLSGKKYYFTSGDLGYNDEPDCWKEDVIRMRTIADHLRAAVFVMGDPNGVGPSNKDQGYVLRRLIRRAINAGRRLGIKDFLPTLAEIVIDIYQDPYTELVENKKRIIAELEKEETKFGRTIEQGMKKFEDLVQVMKSTATSQMGNNTKVSILSEEPNKNLVISGSDAFDLYQSFGFPIEMTVELAKEQGIAVDIEGFKTEQIVHSNKSKQGAEEKFKGGLADHSEMSVKYHTATHLLHAALQKVLGPHAMQKGSNITTERLRFDFTHPEKMTDEEKKAVEDLVNAAIERDYTVDFQELPLEEAKTKGAIGLFDDNYGELVKVYSIGDPDAMPEADPSAACFSREFCGGPHVERTGSLGHFRIKKEESSSAGVRRIKAVLE